MDVVYLIIYASLVFKFAFSLRNGVLSKMFLDFRGPQRLPWDSKDGRKLVLRKKHTFMH